MEKRKKVKALFILHILLFFYSLFGVCSKLAAGERFLSVKFFFFYGIVLLNLFIYALCWQQIIKYMPLVVAFANKAVTVVWGIIFGFLFFQEDISLNKIIGAVIIIVGIVLVVRSKEGIKK